MWGFELLPVSGGASIPVPPGETVLGRGPLLGVSDKRVSRAHALLLNKDGQLRLKSTHDNPVFVQSSSESGPSPLTRDQWRVLKSGDTVSLLPGQLCYKVLRKPDQDQDVDQDVDQDLDQDQELKLKSNQSPDQDQALKSDKNQEPGLKSDPNHNVGRKRDQNQDENHDPELRPDINKDQNLKLEPDHGPDRDQDLGRRLNRDAPPRPRVLPAWMMSAAASSSATCSPPAAAKRGKTSSSSSRRQTTPPVPPRRATPPVTSEGVEQSEEEEELRPKKRQKLSVQAISPDPDPGPDPAPGPGLVPAAVKGSTSAPKRAPCPYGNDCYRKNPVHFQEQSHPGDPDYDDQDQDSDQDSERPECPYGTDCYRKNPQHRKEFSHSRRPARKTRKPRAAPEDEDEYESSFIDSGSDYEPPRVQSSSESEDLSQLQDEATGFIRGHK